ncbi:hypothetical protein ACFSTD_11010 [Novosphingobium colocasiae]|uniref:Uncharacterized protein n=1 Tax=Novosphingobium colocasiae TaxID=1256513 RepID=A0A918UEL5_9SPHN|nr:hypothetical protein [Novosphingobium colocasiae]GGY96353.1 hypothetical protein GCM10011614_08950 [Novosphingobium colocasiae]
MTDHIGTERAPARAFLRVAGASVAKHQLGLVLALDCQRVICFARGSSPEMIELQHAAEAAGLQFYLAVSTSQLAGLITAADELIVVTEGLLADPAAAAGLLEGRGPVVLVQPAETAIPQGFERIDINRGAGGVMRLPGQLAEHLHALPPDVDVVSALTRIALQSGIGTREIPAAVRVGPNWRMIGSEAEAQGVEQDWLRASFGSEGRSVGGKVLARMAVLALGPSLLHAGNASVVASLAVLALVLLVAASTWFGVFWLAFALLAMATIVVEAGRLLRAAERRATGIQPPAIPRADALTLLCDGALVGVMLAASPQWQGLSWLGWLFAPLMLMLMLLLVPRVVGTAAERWAGDRTILCLLLTAAAAAGMVNHAVQIMALGLAAAALLLPARAR